MRSLTGVIWDKDGTLLNTQELWIGREKALARLLISALRPDAPVRTANLLENQCLGNIGILENEVLPDALFSRGTEDAILLGLLEPLAGPGATGLVPLAKTLLAQVIRDLPGTAPAFPESESALREFHAQGLPTALVTADSRRHTLGELDHLGWSHLFHPIVCGDDEFPPKPHPASLEFIAGIWGLSPGRLLVIGDTESDREYAHRGGAQYLSVRELKSFPLPQ